MRRVIRRLSGATQKGDPTPNAPVVPEPAPPVPVAPTQSIRDGWAKPLVELADRLRDKAAAWPTVRFRCLISESQSASDDEPWQVLWAYFELTTEQSPAQEREAVKSPRVIHGGIPLQGFVSLLEQWAIDQPAPLGEWTVLAPPGIDVINHYGPWMTDDPNFRVSLLGTMPQSDAPFLVERLQGTGRQFDAKEDYNRLYSKMTKQRGTPDLWQREFMHFSIAVQNFAVLVIEIPTPVAITYTADHEALAVAIDVCYRAPDTEDSFEVRVGKQPWAPDRTPLEFQNNIAESDGWWRLHYTTRVEEPGDHTIWVTRPATDEDFDWAILLQLGDPDPLTSRVQQLLDVWFALNRVKAAPTFAKALEARPANPPKGTASGRYFEVALHAACTVLRLPTFYGDQTLMTPGVDILAFDRERHWAFAISAVTDTSIDAKLTKWVAVRDRVVGALLPDWTVRPIIITSQPLADCNSTHIEDAYHQGVMVLGAEDLACLKDSPPKWVDFGRTLRLTLFGRQSGYRLVPLPGAEGGWRIVDLS